VPGEGSIVAALCEFSLPATQLLVNAQLAAPYFPSFQRELAGKLHLDQLMELGSLPPHRGICRKLTEIPRNEALQKTRLSGKEAPVLSSIELGVHNPPQFVNGPGERLVNSHSPESP